MNKVLNVTLFVPLLYVTFFIIYWAQIYQNEMISLDEFILEKQVNYAADAAVEEILNTGNLDQDYHNLDKSDPTLEALDTSAIIAVEPSLAVEEFASMLCANFNMLPTEYNINVVKSKYIRALLVCAYDGVYTYWRQESSKGVYDFMGTPKIPYFYTENEGKSNQKQYCINLGYDYGYSDAMKSGDYSLKKYSKIEVNKDLQRTAINNQVAELLNWALYQSYSNGTGSGKTYQIPALGSEIQGQQPVNNITVLGVVEGKATSSATSITAECIGGARVTSADRVIGYKFSKKRVSDGSWVDFNQYFYATTSTWEKLGPGLKNMYEWSTDSAKSFNSVFEAASSGYYSLLTNLKGDWEDANIY